MKYPFINFAFAIITYLFLLLFFALSFLQRNEAPQVSLTIDANLIGEGNVHAKAKVKQRKVVDLQQVKDERKTEKSAQEKLEPQQEKEAQEEEEEFHEISQKIAPIYQPLPEIPDDLRYEAFNTKAVARFFVLKNGEVFEVKLAKPSASPKLNHLLLKSLRKWKFPKNEKGFVQEITVTFKVL